MERSRRREAKDRHRETQSPVPTRHRQAEKCSEKEVGREVGACTRQQGRCVAVKNPPHGVQAGVEQGKVLPGQE